MTEPASPLHEARALLRQFQHGKARACHIRTPTLELFLSRDRACRPQALPPAPDPDPAPAALPASPLAAPHLATVVELAGVGLAVAAGDVLARLRVLDRHSELRADSACVVAAHHLAPGALVQFGEALLSIQS
ncbi:MAG TPA: hypothetical protein VFF98_11485 [Novosphingobium sp.]|nr:hypothetical protein [Novosphingobium sp.]